MPKAVKNGLTLKKLLKIKKILDNAPINKCDRLVFVPGIGIIGGIKKGKFIKR